MITKITNFTVLAVFTFVQVISPVGQGFAAVELNAQTGNITAVRSLGDTNPAPQQNQVTNNSLSDWNNSNPLSQSSEASSAEAEVDAKGIDLVEDEKHRNDWWIGGEDSLKFNSAGNLEVSLAGGAPANSFGNTVNPSIALKGVSKILVRMKSSSIATFNFHVGSGTTTLILRPIHITPQNGFEVYEFQVPEIFSDRKVTAVSLSASSQNPKTTLEISDINFVYKDDFTSLESFRDTYTVTYAKNQYLNWGGHQEKWFRDESGNSFYITPPGDVYKWTTGTVAGMVEGGDEHVASLTKEAYDDLSLLVQNDPAKFNVGLRHTRNWGGHNEIWFRDEKTKIFYYMTEDGTFYRWGGTRAGMLTTDRVVAKFTADDYENPTKRMLKNASALVEEFDLARHNTRNYAVNWSDVHQEKWIKGPGASWLYILPNGDLYFWSSGTKQGITKQDTLLAKLTQFHYEDTAWLTGKPIKIPASETLINADLTPLPGNPTLAVLAPEGNSTAVRSYLQKSALRLDYNLRSQDASVGAGYSYDDSSTEEVETEDVSGLESFRFGLDGDVSKMRMEVVDGQGNAASVLIDGIKPHRGGNRRSAWDIPTSLFEGVDLTQVSAINFIIEREEGAVSAHQGQLYVYQAAPFTPENAVRVSTNSGFSYVERTYETATQSQTLYDIYGGPSGSLVTTIVKDQSFKVPTESIAQVGLTVPDVSVGRPFAEGVSFDAYLIHTAETPEQKLFVRSASTGELLREIELQDKNGRYKHKVTSARFVPGNADVIRVIYNTGLEEDYSASTGLLIPRTFPLPEGAVATASNPEIFYVNSTTRQGEFYDIYNRFGKLITTISRSNTLSPPDASKDGSVLVQGQAFSCKQPITNCLRKQLVGVWSLFTGEEIRDALTEGVFLKNDLDLKDRIGFTAKSIRFLEGSSEVIRVVYQNQVVEFFNIVTGEKIPSQPLPAGAIATVTNPQFFYVERVEVNTSSIVLSFYDIYNVFGKLVTTIEKDRVSTDLAGRKFRNLSLGPPDVSEDGSLLIHAQGESCTISISNCLLKQRVFVWNAETGEKQDVFVVLRSPVNPGDFEGNNFAVTSIRFVAGLPKVIRVDYDNGRTEFYNVTTGELIPSQPLPDGAVRMASNPGFFYVQRSGGSSLPAFGGASVTLYDIYNATGNLVTTIEKDKTTKDFRGFLDINKSLSTPDVSSDGAFLIHAQVYRCTRSNTSCLRRHQIFVFDATTGERLGGFRLKYADLGGGFISGNIHFVKGSKNLIRVVYRGGIVEFYKATKS